MDFRDFASSLIDDAVAALDHAIDPAQTCTLRAVAWTLDHDDIHDGAREGLVGALIYEDSATVNTLMAHCVDELMSAGRNYEQVSRRNCIFMVVDEGLPRLPSWPGFST